jgi:hypothetical protein
MFRRTLSALGLLLVVGVALRAQPMADPVPFTDRELGAQPFPPPAYSPNRAGPALQEYGQPLPGYPTPIGEPPWCDSPYRSSAWRLEFAFVPTISHVSELAFGDWSDSGSVALRLNLGYEGCESVGTRLQFWGFDDEQTTLAGRVDLTASTFYWDFYKRFFIQDAELVLGAGLAGAGLQYDLKTLHERATLSAGGISVFGEGFYPLWRFKKTDVGSIGRARLTLLSGQWEDRGTPFVDDTDHDLTTIIELAWGLEIRRRFGLHEDKYWYIDIVPEFQRWESASLPDEFDPGFQGTAINFGLAW